MENRTPRAENPPARATSRPLDNTDEGREETEDTAGAENDPDLRLGGDIGFDRVVGSEEVGLGGGLDQAEEARLGITDEELAETARGRRTPKR